MATHAADPAPTSLPLGPGSVTHRVTMEPVMLVASGGRALLLQVSHPVVGAGVADHSDYARRPYDRLLKTLQVMTALALGTPEASQRMARHLRRTHATITGTLPDGQPYRALDADNMAWVWATLLDTLVAVHDAWVRPLSAPERDRLYAEWLLIAEACGLDRADCPPDWDAFADEVAATVERELVATETAQVVAGYLRRPPLPFPLDRAAGVVLSVIGPGQLPDRLRRQLGITWTPRHDRALAVGMALARAVARVTPGPLRRLPVAAVTYPARRMDLPVWGTRADERSRTQAAVSSRDGVDE